jgi:hypothetical protein
MSPSFPDVGAVLLHRGIISQEQLNEAKSIAQHVGGTLSQAIVALGFASNLDVLRASAEAFGLPYIDLTNVFIPETIIELVPESVARENIVLPIMLEDRSVIVAIADPEDLDTLQKLSFILNKTIRPVLAAREQIIAAINLHYGQSETESVDSMLCEFTDTAIDFTETDDDQEYQLTVDDEDILRREQRRDTTRSPLVSRRATVRYYHRMNPDRLFPFLVILSARSIQEIVKRGVGQSKSATFKVAEGSFVEIEPIIPGCACYPPKETLCVESGTMTATFWVVPHVLGKVTQARVMIRQQGATLAEVPLEMTIVRQSLTVLMGALSLVLPFLLMLLKHFDLDFETQLKDGFSLYAQLASWLVRSLTPELLTGMLLAATAGMYLWLRPSKRDVFWDLEPEETDEETQDQARADDPDELFRRADQAYEAGDYAKALSMYQAVIKAGTARAVHYFRASLAVSHLGDNKRALQILQKAKEVLPKKAMKGPLWYNMACFSCRLGRLADALRYLENAVDAGYANLNQLNNDPDLEPLRWNRGFKRILAELRGVAR